MDKIKSMRTLSQRLCLPGFEAQSMPLQYFLVNALIRDFSFSGVHILTFSESQSNGNLYGIIIQASKEALQVALPRSSFWSWGCSVSFLGYQGAGAPVLSLKASFPGFLCTGKAQLQVSPASSKSVWDTEGRPRLLHV